MPKATPKSIVGIASSPKGMHRARRRAVGSSATRFGLYRPMPRREACPTGRREAAPSACFKNCVNSLRSLTDGGLPRTTPPHRTSNKTPKPQYRSSLIELIELGGAKNLLGALEEPSRRSQLWASLLWRVSAQISEPGDWSEELTMRGHASRCLASYWAIRTNGL